MPALLRKGGGGGLVGGGSHRRGVLRQDEPFGDAVVERSVPLGEVRSLVGVKLVQFSGGERPAVPDDRLLGGAVVTAAVLACRYREVGEPNAADRVAVMVASDRGWLGGLEFDASLRRWRRASLEPSVWRNAARYAGV